MRGTLQESKRTEPDQEDAGSPSGPGRKRNARRYAVCFLLILACVLLVCWANGTWPAEEQPGPDLLESAEDVPAQAEDPSAPSAAVSAPLAREDSAAAEERDSESPAEEQDPEPSAENGDPETPAEEQGPETPAEKQTPETPAGDREPEDPDRQNTVEADRQSEDPAQEAQETPEAADDTPPPTMEEKLDAQVQKVLDSIITDGMTKLEQAKAVWSFTKNGISYTGSSDKSDWISGAYTGLTARRGDCFTYYAVSRALLTALGIDNLEVRRVGGVSSHYWNLVNCGDGWYHFDATPRSGKMPYFVSFMFTDEEAAAYTAKVGGGREYYAFDGSLYPERGTGDPAAELSG